MKQDFKVLWAGSAVQDLESIIAYIAEDSPAHAKKILSKINKTAAIPILPPSEPSWMALRGFLGPSVVV